MERNFAIDTVKCFAMIAVVIIHTNPFQNVNVFGINGGYIDFSLDTVSRFAVPFFFMAAGYLLGQKALKGGFDFPYFSKYIYKLVSLYVFWQLIYILYDVMMIVVKSLMMNLNTAAEIWRYTSSIHVVELIYYSEGSTGYHLWFLTSLIVSVILLFLSQKYKLVNILFWAGLFLHLVGLLGQSYSGLFSFPLQTRDALFFGIFYTTLGYIFSQRNLNRRFPKKVSLRTYLLGIVAISAIQLTERAVLVSQYDGNMGDYFLSTILLSVVLFLMLIHHPQLGKNAIWPRIGAKSVGIYIIHVLIINASQHFLVILEIGTLTQTMIWHLLFTPFVFSSSFLIYETLQWLKKKVKFMHMMKGERVSV